MFIGFWRSLRIGFVWGDSVYPYLLRGTKIERADQGWSTDITYISMQHGYMYLAAVITEFGFSQATISEATSILGGTLGFAAPEQIDP